MTEIKIKLDVNGVINPLHKQLEECSNNILFGLQILEQVKVNPPDLGLLEGSILMPIKIGEANQNIEIKKGVFKSWLIKKGFEDLIKGIELSLREAYLYTTIYSMPIEEIKTESEFAQFIDSILRKSSKLDIPKMIEKVEERLIKPLSYKKQILSINKGRNCLVHRNGLVTKKDINNTEEQNLKIEWIKFNFFYKKEGNEEEISKPGTLIPGGSSIELGIKDESISFNEGDKIDLEYKQFNELIITCLQFGNDLCNCLPTNKKGE